MRNIFLLLTAVGCVVPLAVFFGLVGNFPPPGEDLLQAFFANQAAAAATADVLVASLVLWVWVLVDDQGPGRVALIYLVPITLLLGLCAAFPLYLWLRARPLPTN